MSSDPHHDPASPVDPLLSAAPPGAPPPPDHNASPEEKDLWWYQNVYQGDNIPQFTWRAVIVGGLIGMVMAASNLYTSVKLGWAFGVTITACVLAYSLGTIMKAWGMRPLTMLENNCMQSTASAAGYSTGGTVGAAFGALLMVEGTHQHWPVVMAFVFLTAALGVFLAVPFKRQMINHEQLPFPGGIAAAETTRSLYSEGPAAKRKAKILLIALAIGAFAGLLRGSGDTVAAFGLTDLSTTLKNVFPGELHLPAEWIPAIGSITLLGGFVLDTSVMLVAAGIITGFRIGFSMLLSSAILYFVLSPMLWNQDISMGAPGTQLAEGLVRSVPPALYPAEHPQAGTPVLTDGLYTIAPTRWGLWAGTAILVFASLTGLAVQWRTIARAFRRGRGGAGSADLARIEVPGKWMIIGLVPISIALVWLLHAAFAISIPLGILSVLMSFVVALVCCRSTGETDTTPIGAMGKVTQLLYSVLPGAKGITSINLMSAGATSSAGGAAADLLTDLKSGYLLGANPRKQFLAQACGVFFGSLAIVPLWYLLFPTKEKFESYNPIAAPMWKAMADLLTEGVSKLPPTALWAACTGAFIGIAMPLLEKLMPKAKRWLPSSMGVGLGFVVPFGNALSFFIGGLIAWVWSKKRPLSAAEYMIAIAAGLIAGDGLMSAFSAITQTLAGLAGAGK